MPPPPLAVTANIKAMGHSLEFGCTALASDPSLKRCDRLLSKIKGAEQAITQYRRALVEGQRND